MLKRFFEKLGLSDQPASHKGSKKTKAGSTAMDRNSPRILKRGQAMRVIFFYPGEEGTYVDNATVTLFENGIVHIESNQEESTADLKNCEILWRYEVEAEERVSKVRLLKPKSESHVMASAPAEPVSEGDELPEEGPFKS
jgi:hypothetical protein